MTCPHCGADVASGAATCSVCRAPMSDAAFDVTLGTGAPMPPIPGATQDLSDLNGFETIAATPAPRPPLVLAGLPDFPSRRASARAREGQVE